MPAGKKKVGGKDFVKGNDPRRNVEGRPCIPSDIKQARELTRNEFIRIVTQFVDMNLTDLQAFRKDKSHTVLEHIVASIAEKACAFGDQQRLNFLVEQMFGKLPQKTEHSGTLSLEQIIAGSHKEDT